MDTSSLFTRLGIKKNKKPKHSDLKLSLAYLLLPFHSLNQRKEKKNQLDFFDSKVKPTGKFTSYKKCWKGKLWIATC